MEWWAIFIMVIVLCTVFIGIFYFVLKIYFPYQFAVFSYHVNTRGQYASNEPPTLATFRSHSEGDIIFTETGCYAKQNLASGSSHLHASKEELPTTDSTVLLDGAAASPLGQLQVGLDVDYNSAELIVLVVQARGVNPENSIQQSHEQFSGLYICVDLVHSEDAVSSAKTKMHDCEASLNFKERFLFKVNIPDVSRKVVRFRVVGVSRATGKHEEVSKATLTVADVDITRARKLWLNLNPLHQQEDARGELMLSLTYLPTASRITLVVIKAKNLRWKILRQKTGDVLVSVSLICNGKRTAKRQTSVKRKARDPIFNESLIFSVARPDENVHLRVTVSEVLPTGRIYTVGHCILGPTGSGSELTHWQQMLASPRRPSAMWHWLHRSTRRLRTVSMGATVLTTGTGGNYSNQTSEDSEGANDCQVDKSAVIAAEERHRSDRSSNNKNGDLLVSV